MFLKRYLEKLFTNSYIQCSPFIKVSNDCTKDSLPLSSLHARIAQFSVRGMVFYPQANPLSLHVLLVLQVIPVNSAGSPVGDVPFVRSGLLGFVGPVRNTHLELALLYSFVPASGLLCLTEKHLGTEIRVRMVCCG